MSVKTITSEQDLNPQKAWVLFTNTTDLPWLKMLKKGYRHCSVILHDGQRWITFDPLSNYSEIVVHHMPGDFDLPLWLKNRGHSVVRAELMRPKKPGPWMPISGVESVKRLLGIHAMHIITPWQLYHYLQKQNQTSDIESLEGEFAWEV